MNVRGDGADRADAWRTVLLSHDAVTTDDSISRKSPCSSANGSTEGVVSHLSRCINVPMERGCRVGGASTQTAEVLFDEAPTSTLAQSSNRAQSGRRGRRTRSQTRAPAGNEAGSSCQENSAPFEGRIPRLLGVRIALTTMQTSRTPFRADLPTEARLTHTPPSSAWTTPRPARLG